jgi:hypothetical protein
MEMVAPFTVAIAAGDRLEETHLSHNGRRRITIPHASAAIFLR